MLRSQTRSLASSNAHCRKAVTALPLGVSSNFRFRGKDKTIYLDRARSGRIHDMDGNGYVDYRMGYGPGTLGYADLRVDPVAEAPELHDFGVLCERDSREPWFIFEAPAADDGLPRTLAAFEQAVDITIDKLSRKAATG